MARPKEFKNRDMISITLEKQEREMLEEIRWREHLELTEIGRRAVQEYIKNHASGNSTFKLDVWNKNPDFKAMPVLSALDEWTPYYKESNNQDRTQVRSYLNRLYKIIDSVELNEGRKLKRIIK